MTIRYWLMVMTNNSAYTSDIEYKLHALSKVLKEMCLALGVDIDQKIEIEEDK